MSFTSTIKKELTQLKTEHCCKKAECSALIRMNGTIQLKNGNVILEIATENPATARYIFSLLKDLYQEHPEVLVQKKERLKKNHVYHLRLVNDAIHLLDDLKILNQEFNRLEGISTELIQQPCCQRAYLRGAFLAAGSVNNPDSGSYHMEVFTTYFDHAEALQALMNQYNLHAKIIERKKGYVVYIKEGDKIGEFLNIVGAHPSLLRFENIRIMKDMRNSVNRLVNCETANLNKTIQAAMRQIENIRYIEQEMGLDQLNEKLREVAELRLKNPEANLKELGEMVPRGKMSKSAINHRLRKLNQIAERLKK